MSEHWEGAFDDLSLRQKVTALTSSLSVTVLGYNFLENPEGFVVAAIANWLLQAATSFAGHVGKLIADMWGLLTSSVVDAGAALLAPFGSVGDLVLDGIASINGGLVELASSAGPLAPLVVFAIWAIVVFALLGVAERVIAGVAPWT